MMLGILSLLLLFIPFHLSAQYTSEKDFKYHFQKYGVEGSFILYDLHRKSYAVYKRSQSSAGLIPASTFKIPNSLIALELGIVKDENTIMKWDGQERSIAAWNQDMTFGDAIKVSCVPCYQEIARKVGVKRYHQLLKSLKFGRMDVNSETLDSFWLRGNSNITPMEQIDFLKRLYNNELEVSQRSMDIVKSMLIIEDKEGYVLRGKTGWAVEGDYNVGWFVGWVEKDGKPYFFATNVEATNPDEAKFIQSRVGITHAILKELLPVN
jgi:beta-lactamase class D